MATALRHVQSLYLQYCGTKDIHWDNEVREKKRKKIWREKGERELCVQLSQLHHQARSTEGTKDGCFDGQLGLGTLFVCFYV